ncbi:MAG: DUF481 domain-containing protein, partial [Pseudomonadota bacterium]
YEPNWKLNDRLFIFGLTQYERDRFQGFSARYVLSGGLGYEVLTGEEMTLSVQAGPGWRRTEFVGGGSTSRLSGVASLDFDWAISDTITFTHDASAFIESNSSTFTSDTGLQAAVAGNFAVGISYSVQHDTDPPAGSVKTDTQSRITLIYDF